MAHRSRLRNAKILITLFVTLFVVIVLTSCQTLPKNDATYLDVDVCGVWPDDTSKCHAVPLNESGLEYDRPVMAGDMCVRLDEFAILQKHFKETLRKCGDRCK